MHRFIRSIGFSKIENDYDMETYLERAVNERNRTQVISMGNGRTLEEYQLQVAPSMGIMVVGYRDEYGRFWRDYYFPFMKSFDGTLTEESTIERHTERETYSGVLEDFRTGITLIFYLCNSVEIRELHRMQTPVKPKEAYLTGLALEGKVLLPLEKHEGDEELRRLQNREERALFELAKEGDEEAIETLTETDMNLMSEVSRRIETEDLYTLVESSFMPTGVECDQYTVLGEITGIRVKENIYTHENVVDMTINCNEAIFHICINEADLIGVPAVGRRFKGRIWMQGDMTFTEKMP